VPQVIERQAGGGTDAWPLEERLTCQVDVRGDIKNA
jgi:hypothetical protein